MSTSHVYCTYFDSGYLARALTLFDSLRRLGDGSQIWVLCLDDAVEEYLRSLGDDRIVLLRIAELERYEPELPRVKDGRSRMEYTFTCTPILMRYIVDRQADTRTVVIYLDADLAFFSDPDRAVEAMGGGSIGIIEHRYPGRQAKRLAQYGRFNVGWVGIRADEDGTACVRWWAGRCLEWCFDTPSHGRYADQGYLDRFPELFNNVVIIPDLGMDLAPWNTAGRSIRQEPDGVRVDGDPLVFFHFHGIHTRGRWYVTSQLVYRAPTSRALRLGVYRPYVDALEGNTSAVDAALGRRQVGRRGKGLRGLAFAAFRWLLDLVSVASGNALRAQEPPDAAARTRARNSS